MRRGLAAVAIGSSLATALGGCGQFGPLRFPSETTTDARSRADSRRLPENRRDAPIPATDPSAKPAQKP
jgi:predicted small lipoprotein YifL